MVSLTVGSPVTGAVQPSKSSLKRKASDRDNVDDGPPSSPIKRSKVSFDTSINKIHNLDDYNNKSLPLVREEVRRAIERHRSGDNGAYDALKQLLTTDPFSDDALPSDLLHKHVLAFTSLAPALGKGCSGLVNAILNCSWLGRSESFLDSYHRLMTSLISAQTGYTAPVLQYLVVQFTTLRSSTGRLPNEARVPRPELLDRVHASIRHILNSIPTATGVLQHVLIKLFPYPTDTVRSHLRYVSSLLRVADYAPGLKSEILGTIVERVVKVDAQSQIDIDELSEELDDDLVMEVTNALQQLKEDEAADEESDEEDDLTDLSTVADPSSRRLEELKQGFVKVDCILDLLFEYYESIFKKEAILSQIANFEHLQRVFIRSILPTQGSRHTQFLLFHFGQMDSEFSNEFSTTMLQLASNRNQPAMIRQSAAAYLAGFIARGAHVNAETIRRVVTVLCNELNKLRRMHLPNCNGPDLSKYGTYYCIAQALLYIFCCRWRELVLNYEDVEDDPLNAGEMHWIPGLKDTLNRNIFCELNPLKICAPDIVAQFASICHHLEFISLHLKLEQNKRFRLTRSISATSLAYSSVVDRETALSNKSGDGVYQLDAYFPFDPYQLPRSKRWLDGDYVEWRGIPGVDEDVDDYPVGDIEPHVESEMDEDEEDEEAEEEDMLDEQDELESEDAETVDDDDDGD